MSDCTNSDARVLEGDESKRDEDELPEGCSGSGRMAEKLGRAGKSRAVAVARVKTIVGVVDWSRCGRKVQ